MLADEASVVRASTASNNDSFNMLQPLGNVAQTAQDGVPVLHRQPAAKRVTDDFRNLHNFFQHKMLKTTFLCRFSAPLQGLNRFFNRLVQQVSYGVSLFRENDEFAVFKIDDSTGLREQCRRIRGDIIFARADTKHKGAAKTGDNNLIRLTERHHRKAVGSPNILERSLNCVFERDIVGMVHADKLGKHFSISVRIENNSLANESAAQFRMILNNAVMDYPYCLRGVGVRMRVSLCRGAMRGPARVCDACIPGKCVG